MWIGIVALAGFARFPLSIEAAERPRLRGWDWAVAAIASSPAIGYLALTWNQEFPYGGDQAYHNGAALEAFAFWWWLPWLCAIAALVIVLRFRRLAFPALVLLPLIGILAGPALSFSGRYPGTLHFATAPLHALPLHSPLNAERVVNALAIPIWLLVLRPLILRRNADVVALTMSVFLFWQKDNVYYFTSGYLEPWAIVLLLLAGEHLVVFGSAMIWRPLLLIGAAALIKDHAIVSLPVVAAVYFPRRERLRYIAIVAAAAAPFVLFFFIRGSFKTWQGARPALGAFRAAHFSAFAQRIELQFGAALPVLIFAVCALVVLAVRSRAFAALLAAALLDWLFFFSAEVQQPWVGYPRTNLVPIAFAAIALGFIAARHRVGGIVIVALTAMLNAVVLAPFLRDGGRPDTARNFFEHSDSPIFYPILEGTRLLKPLEPVALLNNGKWTYALFYPGPIEEQYHGVRARVESFARNPQRCRCSANIASLALFIRFTNLGASLPVRSMIESEAEECRRQMKMTCRSTQRIEHEGVLVGLLGRK